jgi:hypothetical protein
MTSDPAANDQDGLLPKPDPAETVHFLMQASCDCKSLWARLLPPSLLSIGFHLFFLPLLLVVRVSLADPNLRTSTSDHADNRSLLSDHAIGEIDFDRHYDIVQIEDVSLVALATKDIQEAKSPVEAKTFASLPMPSGPTGQVEDNGGHVEHGSEQARESSTGGPQAISLQSAASKAGPAGSGDDTRGRNVNGYVPPPEVVADGMLWLAKVTAKDVVYDLGCGDGRFLIVAAKTYGAKVYGCDTDPQRVKEATANVQKNGVQNLVTVEQKSMFDVDLSAATVVMLHLPPSLLEELKPQLEQLPAGAQIVSCDFELPGVAYDRHGGTWWQDSAGSAMMFSKIYIYVAPLKKAPRQ